jgi:hypothetical protein
MLDLAQRFLKKTLCYAYVENTLEQTINAMGCNDNNHCPAYAALVSYEPELLQLLGEWLLFTYLRKQNNGIDEYGFNAQAATIQSSTS